MIHYHGTPINPASALRGMEARHFCVAFSDPRQLDWCLRHAASVMLDNGAFSAWTRGAETDWRAFYEWAAAVRHPHWLVIPDVIAGGEQDNDDLLLACPVPREFAAPVWHMHESLERLRRLAAEWPRVCIGSSGEYRAPGSAAWSARIDAAWDEIERSGARPWVHMLRAMREAGEGPWPFRVGRQHEHRAQSRRGGGTRRAVARSYGCADRRQKPALFRQARPSTFFVVKA
jgi:hypothetical protein